MVSVFSLFVFFLLSYLVLLLSAEPVVPPYNQNTCRPFSCRHLGTIGFPFANITQPNCGVRFIDCSKEPPVIQLGTDGRWYELTRIINSSSLQPNASYILGIRDRTLSENFISGRCEFIENWSIPPSPLISLQILSPIPTFIKCNSSQDDVFEQKGSICPDTYHVYDFHGPRDSIPSGCSTIQLPIIDKQETGDEQVVPDEIEIKVKALDDCSECSQEGGKCQHDDDRKFYCRKEGKRKTKALVIGLIALFVSIGVLIVIGLIFRLKFRSINIINLLSKDNLNHQSVETFLKSNGAFGIKRYSYSNIKKMTNFFRDKLGQGGYGSVYKGKLKDGSLVAVNVLEKSRENGEEFINEVASISRTAHVNIVTLRGFCFEGFKRALVYEFMPNGSLEKFIYQKNPSTDHQLQWETLYKIAVGIARGLEYLHRGCNTRILHFDIKPHNILLDAKFCPKISDFGHAKVCPREQSIISMLGTRGTVGYIAPEVFCRNFGGVSHKSDVYSYGMMVLEMVGGRKNIDVEVDRTSEIYFPHWIYRQLELDEELTLHGLMCEEDRQNAKKMTIVSLWCIQTNPSNRPTMSRVVEMLEMSLNTLQIPPKPFLSSPSRSELASSLTIVSLLHSGSKLP